MFSKPWIFYFSSTNIFAFGNNYVEYTASTTLPVTFIDLSALVHTTTQDSDKSIIIHVYKNDILLRKELDYSLQQITNSAGGVVTRVLFVSDSVGQFTNTDALRVRVFDSIQNSFVPITPSAMNLASIKEPEI